MAIWKRTPTEASLRREEFDRVALRELPLLYRVAKRICLNESDAEDLVGQALFQAIRAWETFDGRYARSWLIRILKNEHIAACRRKLIRPEAPLNEAIEISEDGFWEEVSWRAVGDDILAEVDRLPEEYRLAIALCDVEGLTYDEAAAALDVPVGTVRSRLFRGRRILRSRLARLSCELNLNVRERGGEL
jgi:RNA polymerase sigma-70 factor (ECF subfamily)